MPLRDLLQFLSSGHMLPELPASIRLTEIESALLEHLYNADTPLEHETLMRRIWGHTQELDTHTLETHLYRLRKKLEGSGWQIVTENGHYHLLSSTN